MDLLTVTVVAPVVAMLLAFGVYAGGLLACREESRSKDLARKGSSKYR